MAKNILITGGALGIGWSVAQGLKQRGYRVFAMPYRGAYIASSYS